MNIIHYTDVFELNSKSTRIIIAVYKKLYLFYIYIVWVRERHILYSLLIDYIFSTILRTEPAIIYSCTYIFAAPPENVLILDERGAHITHYILGPFNEGSKVYLTCVSTGGKSLLLCILTLPQHNHQ